MRMILENNVVAPLAERLEEDPRASLERVERAQQSGE